MRIAYLINGYPTISHSFIRREILQLESQGFEIFRIALRGWDHVIVDQKDVAERTKTKYVLQQSLLDFAKSFFVSLFRHPSGTGAAGRSALRMMKKSDRPRLYHVISLIEACMVAGWLIENKSDRIHAHFGTNSAEVAMLAHLLTGVPFSFTMHGSEEFDKPEFIGLPEKLHHASFVSAISSYTRGQLYRWCPYSEWSRIRIVRCGLDEQFIAAPPATLALGNRFVCVCRLDEAKGIMILLEAARRLTSEGLDFEVVFAGDGGVTKPELENRIARLGLNDRVRVTGWLSAQEVHENIRAARCLVLPSFTEGVPVVIMEALALERPAIATYVGGIPELIEDGKSGWLIPAASVEHLVDAMRQCLTRPDDEILAMGAHGRQRVLELHDIETECEKLAELFRQRDLENNYHANVFVPPQSANTPSRSVST